MEPAASSASSARLRSAETSSRMEDVLPSKKASIRGGGFSGGSVADGHQRDGSDPHITGCGTGEFQSGRIVLQEQVWRYSC